MISRRDVVTAGVLGTLATGAAEAGQSQADAQLSAKREVARGQVERVEGVRRAGTARQLDELRQCRPGQVGYPEVREGQRQVPRLVRGRTRRVLRRLRLARAPPAADPDHAHRGPTDGDSIHVHPADPALGERRDLRRHAVQIARRASRSRGEASPSSIFGVSCTSGPNEMRTPFVSDSPKPPPGTTRTPVALSALGRIPRHSCRYRRTCRGR